MNNKSHPRRALLVLAVVLLTLLTVTVMVMAAPEQAARSNLESAQQPLASPIYNSDGTIDIGPVIRNRELPLDQASVAQMQSRLSELEARGALEVTYDVGDERVFLALDNYQGFYFVTTYEVRLISDTVEVWVQSDVSYPSPIHPDSDDAEHITQDRVEGIAAAFEDVIRPTDVNYFGAYDSLDGSLAGLPTLLGLPDDYYVTDDGQRTVILVQNVRDANYYDPANNPSYIAGFYSPTFEFYADRNIITIDSKQWDSRVGAPSYLYESVTVHEMQHLINDDYDSDEDNWPNEGRSEFSEFIAGYRPEPEDHRTTWSDYPENSLTVWGDQDSDPDQTYEILADYQISYWFFLYLTGELADDPGAGLSVEEAVQAVAATTQDTANGIASIDDMLTDVGASFTFAEIFADFRTDMTYGGTSDGTAWGDYVSTYATTSGMSNAPLDLGRLRRNLNFEGYDTPGAPPNGSDYLEIGWSADIMADQPLSLTADVGVPSGWETVAATDIGVSPSGDVSGDVLYSGHNDLDDNFVIFTATVPSSGDQMLSFDTLYNIEETWDYGFVQVTTDTVDATGFTSLALSGTMTETASGAHPIIVANVPGYSGYSGEWMHVEYDLGAYGGQDILLAFRYATDWGSAGQVADIDPGWYVDNVTVGGTALFTEALPPSAMSIWQARGLNYDVDVDFVTYADGNGADINNVYPMTTTTSNGQAVGYFNLGDLLADAGFDGDDERAVAVVSGIAPPVQADLIAAPSEYISYTLEGLPASINTSRLRTEGTTASSSLLRPSVYPGDAFSVTVTVDNFGQNDDYDTVADSPASVAIPLPEHTSVSDSGLYTVTNDLSTMDGALPAVPGVYWSGTVSEAIDLPLSLQVDLPLTIELEITPTAHIANGSFGTASQYFTESGPITVLSPLAFSYASAPSEPIPAYLPVSFEYGIVNTDDASREVDFNFTVPAGTSLHAISVGSRLLAAPLSQAPEDEVQLTLEIPSYFDANRVTVVTVELLADDDYMGDTLSLAPKIYQPDSDILYHEFNAEDATAELLTEFSFMPLVFNNYVEEPAPLP